MTGPPSSVTGEGTLEDMSQAARPTDLGVAPQPRTATAAIFGRPNWLPLVLILGDAAIAGVSVILAYEYRYHLDRIPQVVREPLAFGPYVAAIPVVIAIYLFALSINQQYRSWRGRTLVDQLFAMASGSALAAMLMLAGMSLYRGFEYARLTFVYTVIIAAVLMTAERYLLRQYETRLRRRGIGTERVLMVGTGTGSQLLIQRMAMFPQYGYHVSGVLDDHLELGSSFAGTPVVGRIGDLRQLIPRMGVDQVFVAVPGATNDEILHLVKTCDDLQAEFKLVPDLLEVMSTRAAVDAIDGLPLIGIRRSRLRGPAAVLKRAIDIVISAVALIITSPVMLVIAIAIKLTSPRGPIFFRQPRVGLHDQRFTVYKFRSMIPDAEAQTGPVVAAPDDDRCTPVGRVLRRLSLDELPQLFNILKGDMSLVGPRPMPIFLVERFTEEIPRYLERHQVRPGLTGWAQVNDLRGGEAFADRAMYDIYYVENWSLALDLKILILTAARVFFQRRAY
ncbi:MAG: undecaprenyl-phosphate glucose phosphotransferase [Chloroflexi bacterium]|nr:MAG: undecaprenyl-phosphate glucose phosphotransferase [Chloroflexota bacterium]TMD68002.1 MAG: undecaprenyl-phosphate glucose phosphotransferase [Chloroflexota bacterium]